MLHGIAKWTWMDTSNMDVSIGHDRAMGTSMGGCYGGETPQNGGLHDNPQKWPKNNEKKWKSSRFLTWKK